MAIKYKRTYTNIFHFKTLKKNSEMRIFVLKLCHLATLAWMSVKSLPITYRISVIRVRFIPGNQCCKIHCGLRRESNNYPMQSKITRTLLSRGRRGPFCRPTFLALVPLGGGGIRRQTDAAFKVPMYTYISRRYLRRPSVQ
jgi:hypothetical protein